LIRDKSARPRVAIIGTRGYPSFYGGFETAVRNIAPALADAGWDVVVYSRTDLADGAGVRDPRVTSRVTRGLESKALSTLSYGLTSTVDATLRGCDVALVMNVANGFWLPLLRLRGIPVAINVDGIEWERAKWGTVARSIFRFGARLSSIFANTLIVDARAIGAFWRERFNRSSTFIPYGAVERDLGDPPLGLTSRGYILLVARFVPENTVSEFFKAVEELAPDHDVVMVGSAGYGGELDEVAQRLADRHERVRWLGHVADDELLHGLWQHAGAYFHGHSVGGTNPALVQAMMLGAPVVARDTIYNREVLGPEHELLVEPEPAAIAAALRRLMGDIELQRRVGGAARVRARSEYTWAGVAASYEEVLRGLIQRRGEGDTQ
jgi:glycosyltransferase involved in cell wall biosynthesis